MLRLCAILLGWSSRTWCSPGILVPGSSGCPVVLDRCMLCISFRRWEPPAVVVGLLEAIPCLCLPSYEGGAGDVGDGAVFEPDAARFGKMARKEVG